MKTTEIDGVKLRLTQPDELKLKWIGSHESLTQLLAAWTILAEDDIPLNPRILGQPGVGKTTLAYSAAQKLAPGKVYIFQCTMDTRPEDLIIQPVINDENKIEYHASALVSAIINGGICILDEGNRMSEKSWASLAPLLDRRRYVESIIAGIKIRAHEDFRIAVTMNTDSSTYEIPEYIDSRLQPKIYLDYPTAKDEFAILKYNVPYAEDYLLHYLVSFLQNAHRTDKDYSVRDGINIARYYLKLVDGYELDDIRRDTDEDDEDDEDDGFKTDIFFSPKEFELSVEQILDLDAVDFLRATASKKFRQYLKEGSKLKEMLDRDHLKRGFLSDLWEDEDEESFDQGFLRDDIDYDEDIAEEDEEYFDVTEDDGEKDDFLGDLGHLFGPLNDESNKKPKRRSKEDWDDDEDTLDLDEGHEDNGEEFLKFVDDGESENAGSVETKNLDYINKLKSRVKKNLDEIEEEEREHERSQKRQKKKKDHKKKDPKKKDPKKKDPKKKD